ncbi:dynamin-binding protein isoform X2 [Latimeria chalumnae]|uniref:dynamin-binding protein isoform X2 n=1 Tax=Latimeria chalumnae TaxID=7897 RepID=UPI00313CC7FF
MEPGSVVRAVFEFRPSVSEELPLFAGDIIEVLSVVDEFWVLGSKGGVTGQFPSSFVEPVAIPATKRGEKLFVCTNDFTGGDPGSLSIKRGDVVIVEDTVDSHWLRGKNYWGSKGIFPASCVEELRLSSRCQRLTKRSLSELPSYALGQARALMGLSAQLDEELDFREGDIITIVGIPEPGWFEGELEGRRGIFPEGFVELLGPLRTADDHTAQDDSDIYENDLSTDLLSSVVTEEENDEGNGVYGVALYEFIPMDPEELEFSVGDQIRIIRTLEDGWLEGEVHGRRGIFPYRFVKIEETGHSLEADQMTSVPMDSLPEFDYRFDDDSKSEYDLRNNNSNELFFWQNERNGSRIWEPDSCHGKTEEHEPRSEADWSSSLPASEALKFPKLAQGNLEEDLNVGSPDQKPSCYDVPVASFNSSLQTKNGGSCKPQLPPRPKPRMESLSKRACRSVVDLQAETKANDASPSYTLYSPAVRHDVPPSVGNGAFGSTVGSAPWAPSKPFSVMKPKDGGTGPSHCGFSGTIRSLTDRLSDIGYLHLDTLEDPKQKAKRRHSAFSGTTEGLPLSVCSRKTELGGSEGPFTSDSGWGQPFDLDTKLSEQLAQFERSLPSPKPGRLQKASRHFSILDYNSESDLFRGSPQSFNHQETSERRRVLRPPPPKPSTRSSALPALFVQQDQRPSAVGRNGSPSFPLRPSRPAPRPPRSAPGKASVSPRRPAPAEFPASTAMAPWPHEAGVLDDDEPHAQSELGIVDADAGSLPASLVARIQEIERDLEVYTKMRDELSLMMDKPEDDLTGEETLESLEFCNCNIESLALELQQLREMTLLSAQPSVLEPTPLTAATENPEQRMLEKRSKVIEELLQTEQDYIKDLEMCMEKIVLPLQGKHVLNVDFDGLFGNLQAVIDLSKRLLHNLKETDLIGNVFVRYKMDLEEVYKIYCQNHDDAIALLETYEKDEAIQSRFLECLETLRGKTNYINLGSFLIKPVQRVMRYPLLLMELLNTTPESHLDKKPLMEAVLAVKDINTNINEFKRRKDLVMKYRKGDEDTLIDKISKLSMHSIIKKSNRVSSHIKQLTGFSLQIKDEDFEEVEKNFRIQERLIKTFIRNLSLYLQHVRESASVKVLAAISICDLYAEKCWNGTESFQQAHRSISEQFFNDFKDQTERLVIGPLNQLLSMFAGPHKLVQKRFDKLLDYQNCRERAEKMKDKRTQEELQLARNTYEALNTQLLDELPKFHRSAEQLFASCVRSFAEAHRNFVRATLENLSPLLQLSGLVFPDGNIISLFQEEHSRVLQQLQVFSFFPDSLPSLKKPFERKTAEYQSSRKPLSGPSITVTQTDGERTALLSKYPPEKLYQAERNFNAAQELDVTLQVGDIVGVIKQQDPMGSQNRWLIDNGVTKGFVYCSFLKPYNARRSQSDISMESQSSNESGYGGSSPVLSRKDSSSMLNFNPSSNSVSYSASLSRSNQDLLSSSPSQHSHVKDSTASLRSGHSESYCSKPPGQRDSYSPQRANQREPADGVNGVAPCPTQRTQGTESPRLGNRTDTTQRHSHSEVAMSSTSRRNGEFEQACQRPSSFSSERTFNQDSIDLKGQQVFYAIYTFKARCANELSITANQRLKVLEFQDVTGNTEWWLVEVDGRRGYVPSNYIRKTEYT